MKLNQFILFCGVTLIVLNSPVSTLAAQDDHGDNPDQATALQISSWTPGMIETAEDVDCFSFQAVQDEEYEIRIASDDESDNVIRLLDVDGLTVIHTQYEYDEETNMIYFTSPSTGTYYIEVYLNYSNSWNYQIRVSSLSDDLERARQLLRDDQVHEAFEEFKGLLNGQPNNPEINFYVAALRLMDFLETPDPRLTGLLDSFGIHADFIPDASFSTPSPLPESATTGKAIQDYAVEVLLPTIDASIANLEMMQSSAAVDTSFMIVSSLDPETEWFEVDSGDASILKGGLYALKAMIYANAAFNLEVDANDVEDLKDEFGEVTPESIEQLIANHPDALGGNSQVSTRINQALQMWLKGSQALQSGIEFKLQETDPQQDDLFMIDQEEGENALNFLTLMDRTFESLVAVTSGDLDSNGKIDTQDLLILQTMWHRNSGQ